MQNIILPILLLIVCLFCMAVGLLVLGNLLNPRRPGRVKRMPYESGMDPIHDTRRRFDIRFHLLAIAFLVFDVELLFLYPWAVTARPAKLAVAPAAQTAAMENAPDNSVSLGSASLGSASLGSASLGSASPGSASREGARTVAKANESSLEASSLEATAAALQRSEAGSRLLENRDMVFPGVMVFIGLLTLGFIYDWRKGVFRWR